MSRCRILSRVASPAALTFILATFTARLSAQTAGELAVYAALAGTPQGGLPPLLTYSIAGAAQSSAQLAVRYGYLSNVLAPEQEAVEAGPGRERRSVSQYAATAIFPTGLGGTVTLSGGAVSMHCDDCHTYLALSAGGDYRLFARPFGLASRGMRFTLSLNGELAYARAKAGGLLAGNVVSGSVGAPVGVVVGGSGIRIITFVTPALGFANIGGGSGNAPAASGTRFFLGGGVGLLNVESNLQVSLGFQQVLINAADTQVGLAITLGGR